MKIRLSQDELAQAVMQYLGSQNVQRQVDPQDITAYDHEKETWADTFTVEIELK